MALKRCRECGKEVSTEAAACPHCGVKDPTGAKAEADAKTRKGCAWGCASLLIISAVLAVAGSGGDSGGAEPEHSPIMAYIMCEDFVEQRLRAPSTAEFPSRGSEGSVPLGGGKYRVQSHVDAENAFGAMIRSSWDCTIQHVAGTDRWRLESLSID